MQFMTEVPAFDKLMSKDTSKIQSDDEFDVVDKTFIDI